MPRPLVLVIDVEPDLRKPRTGQGGWNGLLDALPRFEQMRERFARATGNPVRLNWYLRMDPQIERVWGDPCFVSRAAPALFEIAARHGDHFGIHPHVWRWHEREQDWFSDVADEAWARHCFQTAYTAFENVLGHPPSTCRFGDRCVTETCVTLMEEAGIRVDITIEPGLPEEQLWEDPLATGLLPDCRRAPRTPYQPDREDYLRPALAGEARKLWMLPLSTTPPYWRWVRRGVRIGCYAQSPSLILAPRRIGRFLAREIGRATYEPLVFTVRGGDLSDGLMLRQYQENVTIIENAPGIQGCAFVTPEQAVDRWRTSRIC